MQLSFQMLPSLDRSSHRAAAVAATESMLVTIASNTEVTQFTSLSLLFIKHRRLSSQQSSHIVSDPNSLAILSCRHAKRQRERHRHKSDFDSTAIAYMRRVTNVVSRLRFSQAVSAVCKAYPEMMVNASCKAKFAMRPPSLVFPCKDRDPSPGRFKSEGYRRGKEGTESTCALCSSPTRSPLLCAVPRASQKVVSWNRTDLLQNPVSHCTDTRLVRTQTCQQALKSWVRQIEFFVG